MEVYSYQQPVKESQVSKLYQLAAKVVYYINLNMAERFTKIMDWYCLCSKFSGCPLPNDIKDYCFICQIEKHCNSYEIEKNYDINYIIKTITNLKGDLDEYTEFDPSSDYFWLDDNTRKFRGLHGRETVFYLTDYVNQFPKIKKFH